VNRVSRAAALAYHDRTGLRPDEAAGLRSVHRGRSGDSWRLVAVYQAEEAGIEDDPANPWASVCEMHATLMLHPTRRLAEWHAVEPEGWCDGCRALI